jgi:hypothetical protein
MQAFEQLRALLVRREVNFTGGILLALEEWIMIPTSIVIVKIFFTSESDVKNGPFIVHWKEQINRYRAGHECPLDYRSNCLHTYRPL